MIQTNYIKYFIAKGLTGHVHITVIRIFQINQNTFNIGQTKHMYRNWLIKVLRLTGLYVHSVYM